MSFKGTSTVSTPVSGLPISGFTAITGVFTKDVAITAGAITALTGTTVTATVAGLLTTDTVIVNCVSAVSPAGMIIANARVSLANTLELTINTAVALGITLGALTFRVTVLR